MIVWGWVGECGGGVWWFKTSLLKENCLWGRCKKKVKKTNNSAFSATHTNIKLTLVSFFSSLFFAPFPYNLLPFFLNHLWSLGLIGQSALSVWWGANEICQILFSSRWIFSPVLPNSVKKDGKIWASSFKVKQSTKWARVKCIAVLYKKDQYKQCSVIKKTTLQWSVVKLCRKMQQN